MQDITAEITLSEPLYCAVCEWAEQWGCTFSEAIVHSLEYGIPSFDTRGKGIENDT